MQNYRTKARVPTTKHGYLPQSFLYLGLVSLSIWFGQFLTLKFSFHTDMSELLYHVMLHWRSEFLECMCVIYRNMMHSSMLGILLTLECVATELFYIWRNCHRVLTDLYSLRIIFFLSYKITTKFINILIKRAYNEFAFLFFFYILE